MRSRRSASKRPFSRLVSIFPGNSRYNETQNRENWIFLDSRKSAQMLIKTSLKMSILSWKIHFLWSPLRGRFSAKNTNFGEFFQNSISPGFSLFITNSLISMENPIFAKNVKFRLCQPIFAIFTWAEFFPRSGQGVTLGQGYFFKVWNYHSTEWPLGALFEKFLKIFQNC